MEPQEQEDDEDFFGAPPEQEKGAIEVYKPLQAIPVPSVLQEFTQASVVPFTAEQTKILEQEIPPDEIDILPTGEVYATQVRYRRILNEAFGAGGWAMLPRGQWYQDGNTICREYWLMAQGRFVSQAIGESEYQPDNPRMSRATALEAVKSNALTRCCKDLLIASVCWDKHYINDWKKGNAVAVWCINVGGGKDKGKKKKLWRRKDGEKFEYPWREEGGKRKAEPEDESQEPDTEEEPVPAPNELFLKAMATELKRLGRERFYEVLGGHGFSDPNEIHDRATQKAVFKALTMMTEGS